MPTGIRILSLLCMCRLSFPYVQTLRFWRKFKTHWHVHTKLLINQSLALRGAPITHMIFHVHVPRPVKTFTVCNKYKSSNFRLWTINSISIQFSSGVLLIWPLKQNITSLGKGLHLKGYHVSGKRYMRSACKESLLILLSTTY